MEKLETIILGTTEEDIRKGADIIRSGGLVAFPTETVYGLGANGMDAEASAKIYAAKGRPSDNPMIVHIADRSELSGLTDEVTADMETLMDAFWPGPMTMVVKAKPEVPKVTTGGLDTVAVRMPNHPVALALIAASGVPIAAPSANASGRPSPTTGQHVIDDLDGRINAVVMGDSCQIGIESTVIDMTGEVPMILRPGKLTEADFEKVLGKPVALDPALLKKPQFISCLEPQDGPAQVMDEDFRPIVHAHLLAFAIACNLATSSREHSPPKSTITSSTPYFFWVASSLSATNFLAKLSAISRAFLPKVFTK